MSRTIRFGATQKFLFQSYFLTLAGPIAFLHTEAEAVGATPPLAVWPLIELEIWEKRACRALRDAAIDT